MRVLDIWWRWRWGHDFRSLVSELLSWWLGIHSLSPLNSFFSKGRLFDGYLFIFTFVSPITTTSKNTFLRIPWNLEFNSMHQGPLLMFSSSVCVCVFFMNITFFLVDPWLMYRLGFAFHLPFSNVLFFP